MKWSERQKLLAKMPAAAALLDDWLRAHAGHIGLVHFTLAAAVDDTGLHPEVIIEALFELDASGLIAWDEEELVVYITGWALAHAAPGFLTQIAWRAQATKWPDTGPRAALERELEQVKQQGRPRLQLVANDGAEIAGPARIMAVRR